MNTTMQLFGKYLLLRTPDASQEEHLDLFRSFLREAGCPASHIDSQVEAISMRVNVGFAMQVNVSEELRTKSASQMSDTKLQAWITNDPTGDLRSDIHGVGPKSVEKMAAHGVLTTWQLFGQFLMTMDEVQTATKAGGTVAVNDASQFEEWLTSVGTAASYRASVIVQLVEKLGCGLWLPGDREKPEGFTIKMQELSIHDKKSKQ